ncbi:MAG: hypothetical protein AB7E08_03810 [Candidatus Omnitrophota bacterium]
MKKNKFILYFLFIFLGGLFPDSGKENIIFAEEREREDIFFIPVYYTIDRVQGKPETMRFFPWQRIIPYSLPEASPEGDSSTEAISSGGGSIELDASFTQGINPPFLGPLTLPPHNLSLPVSSSLDPSYFQKLLAEMPQERTTIILSPVDTEKRIFRVTLKDRELGALSFLVSMEGVYGLTGELQGHDTVIKWDGKEFRLSVSVEGEELKVKLIPANSEFPLEARYLKNFSFADFTASLKFDFIERNPCMELIIKKESVEVLKARISNLDAYLQGEVAILEAERGRITVEAGNLSYQGGELEGVMGISFQSENDNRVSISFGVGEEKYIELVQDSASRREIIEAFFTELAGDLKRAMIENPDEFWGINPEITVEEIKQILLSMVEDEENTLRMIEEINQQREGLTVPHGLRIMLNLSRTEHEPIARVILPLLTRTLALKFSALPEGMEASLVYALADTGRTIEAGYFREEEEGIFFQIAEPGSASAVGFDFSFTEGISALNWIVRGIKGRIDTESFSLASTSMNSSLLDFLFKINSLHNFQWGLHYDFGGIPEFDLELPLDDWGYKKSYIILSLDKSGIEMGFKLPFIWGGILELKGETLKYTLDNKDIYFEFFMRDGRWQVEFSYPREKE